MCLSNVRRRILNLINHPATCSLIIIVVIIRPPYKLCIPPTLSQPTFSFPFIHEPKSKSIFARHDDKLREKEWA